jgi:hypothetical protein
MPNSTDTRRVAVWLVGAMFSACACLFLACSCLGVRAWAATGRDTAPSMTDPRREMITASPTTTSAGARDSAHRVHIKGAPPAPKE